MYAVVAIVENNGKVLLGKKRKLKKHFLSGKWHIPGGRVENGEADEAALVREMREEAGIEIKIGRFLAEYYDNYLNTRARWYLCSCGNEKLRPGGDLEDVKWVDKKDVMKICDRKAVERWPRKIKEFFE